jgi:hypothetical protein
MVIGNRCTILFMILGRKRGSMHHSMLSAHMRSLSNQLVVYAPEELRLPKTMMFCAVKGLLGTLTAHAETRFVTTLSRVVGLSAASNATVFLLFAPGVFFASTAHLPSAVCICPC